MNETGRKRVRSKRHQRLASTIATPHLGEKRLGDGQRVAGRLLSGLGIVGDGVGVGEVVNVLLGVGAHTVLGAWESWESSQRGARPAPAGARLLVC